MYYRVALLVVGLFLCPCLNAQNLHHTYHFSDIDVGNRIVISPDGNFILGGSTGRYQGWPMFKPVLISVSPEGTDEWFHFPDDISFMEIGMVRDISFDEEQNIGYALVFASGCDYGLPNAIYQFTPEGDLSLLTELEFDASHFKFVPGLGIIIQASYSKILYRYDFEDNIVHEINLLEGYSFFSRDIAVADASKIAMIGHDYVFLIDHSTSMPTLVTGMDLEGGDHISYFHTNDAFIATAGETLYELDGDNLQINNSRVLTPWGYPRAVKCYDNQIYVLCSDDGDLSIAIFNQALDLVDEIDLSVDPLYVVDFVKKGNKIIVTGAPRGSTNPLYDNKGSDIFIRSYELGQGSNSGLDVSLFAMSCSDTSVLIQDGYCVGGQMMSLYFTDIQVEITNHSDVVVDNVVLYTGNTICSFICSSLSTSSRVINNMDLQTGESMILDFGDFSTQFIPYNDNFNLCLSAASPNRQLDDDFGNNTICIPIDVTTIVSTDNPVQTSDVIKVYPNPATDILYVDTGELLTLGSKIVIKDLLGASLQQIQPAYNKQIQLLDIAHLPPGVYILSVEKNQNISAQKWVKY